jgi:mono/diheme cytochrome c family protein
MTLRNICIAFALVFSLSACGDDNNTSENNNTGNNDTNPFAGDAEAAAAGKGIYEGKGSCTSCHGADGSPGMIAAVDLRGSSLSDGELYSKISDGVPGTSMTAYKNSLTEDEIWQLVTHIQVNF